MSTDKPSVRSSRGVIVVGATGAVGRAVAQTLHANGYSLTLTHHSGEPTSSVAPAAWHKLDVRNPGEVKAMFDEVQRESDAPYALVYAAGVNRDQPLLTMAQDDWREVVETNLAGAFHCIQAVARSMLVAGRGRIILIGSVTAKRPLLGQAAYSAAKAGLEALCRVAALEFGRSGVTCNVVSPGALQSPMFAHASAATIEGTIRATPVRRLGEPVEVADAVRYLLSDEAAFITGQSINIDGGLSIA